LPPSQLLPPPHTLLSLVLSGVAAWRRRQQLARRQLAASYALTLLTVSPLSTPLHQPPPLCNPPSPFTHTATWLSSHTPSCQPPLSLDTHTHTHTQPPGCPHTLPPASHPSPLTHTHSHTYSHTATWLSSHTPSCQPPTGAVKRWGWAGQAWDGLGKRSAAPAAPILPHAAWHHACMHACAQLHALQPPPTPTTPTGAASASSASTGLPNWPLLPCCSWSISSSGQVRERSAVLRGVQDAWG
jgi:hypothetical protein